MEGCVERRRQLSAKGISYKCQSLWDVDVVLGDGKYLVDSGLEAIKLS